jgi:hypothetical protein
MNKMKIVGDNKKKQEQMIKTRSCELLCNLS